MKISFQGDLSKLTRGINILAPELGFEIGEGELEVTAQRAAGDLKVNRSGNKAIISFEKDIHFFRGLGLLIEAVSKGKENFTITETPQFTTNGAMFDCSRNAVMKPETVKTIMRKMAIMGLDTLMLYTEDTYEVPQRPYFGYLRGRYSHEELAELDQYAEKLGIEIVPCIQTLAHLAQALKWNVMAEYRDTEDILLADNEKTYEFIEELIAAASRPFRSKRIHIGMDEAHGLGLGRYLDLYGYQRRFEIMLRHLEKVLAITQKYGLEPMIWSDMFFRLGSKTGDYYDLESQIPEDIIEKIPKGVRFVYWDYYHKDEAFYREWIKRHRSLGSEPIFAGGIWTWAGMCLNYGKTFVNTNSALTACKKEGVKDVFATLWGDDGGENNYYAALLGLQLFAEHGYSRELTEGKLKERFEFCTKGSFEAFLDFKYFDETPGTSPDNLDAYNPSKYLLWQDLFLGLFDANIKGLPLSEHYGKLAEKFHAYKKDANWGFLFNMYERLAIVLAKKAELGLRIRDNYQAGEKKALAKLVEEELPELHKEISLLRSEHRKLWHHTYKPFGWEVLDIRYGGMLSRLDTVIWRLEEYLAGNIAEIPELEEEKLTFNGGEEGTIVQVNRYRRIATPTSEF